MSIRQIADISAACGATLVAAAFGWWQLSSRLPPVSEDEWPYVGCPRTLSVDLTVPAQELRRAAA